MTALAPVADEAPTPAHTRRPIRTIDLRMQWWQWRRRREIARRQDALRAAWDRLYEEATQRLADRIVEHAAPAAQWAPAQDIAVVYRLPNDYQSPNGLILPDRYKEGHDSPFSLGILITAGPEAMDVLESHGVLPGDYVKFARFAGEEEAAGRVARAVSAATGPIDAQRRREKAIDEEMGKKKILELQVPFIHGSVDLLDRLEGEKPTMEMVREIHGNRVVHMIQPILEGE